MNREEAKSLLPWFAVASLDADDARAVEAHLQASPELQRELAELQVLQQAVGNVTDEPVFRPAMMNDALRQIDAYEATRPVSSPENPITMAMDWLRETLVDGWVRAPAGARLAMVAQFALILVLGGVLLTPTGPATNGDPTYSTAAGDPLDGTEGATGTTLDIIFQPTVTEQRMRELLADVGGKIVAGPSARGSYAIRIPSESDADINQVLNTLRGHADAIRFATKAE